MTLSLLFEIKIAERWLIFLAERWRSHRNRIHHLVITASLWTVYHFIGSIPFGWLTNKQLYDLLFTPDCKRNEADKTFSSQMLQMLNCYLTATRWPCTLRRKSLGWKIDIFMKEAEKQSLANSANAGVWRAKFPPFMWSRAGKPDRAVFNRTDRIRDTGQQLMELEIQHDKWDFHRAL